MSRHLAAVDTRRSWRGSRPTSSVLSGAAETSWRQQQWRETGSCSHVFRVHAVLPRRLQRRPLPSSHRRHLPGPAHSSRWPRLRHTAGSTWWATSVPILVFLGFSVVDLGPMYTTDRQDVRQTDVRRVSSLNASALWGRGHKNQTW